MRKLPPSFAWLTVFLPTLAYFLATRLPQIGVRGTNVGELVVVEGDNEPVFRVFSSHETSNLVASTWRYDSELGRGYLLLSDAADDGRVWRWEVGGGPIVLGKTLHLDKAGCRNGPCTEGTGGLTIDFKGHERPTEGRLVLAECGEARIVRMEDTGARTPLVLGVPNLCDETSLQRTQNARSMLMTPFGDLVFVEDYPACGKAALLVQRGAIHIPPLASLKESFQAHNWTSIEAMPNVWNKAPSDVQQIGGLAMVDTWTTLLATVQHVDGEVILYEIPLTSDDDASFFDLPWKKKMDLSSVGMTSAGPLVVTKDGTIVCANGEELVTLEDSTVFGVTQLPDVVTSLTLSDDGWLYITTPTSLLRRRMRKKPDRKSVV